MEIEKILNNDELILKLTGMLDTSTSPDFEALLDSTISDDIKLLILDLSNLQYISSAGLRVILKAQKIMNKQGEMKLTGVKDTVLEVFNMTGFSDILNIE
ncbi:MAG: STAS domain-containing protein [Lachnospirales bacterium]